VVYSLIFFWFLIAGPGKASLDTFVARWLGIRTQD
jgi:putative oxidoreductase